MTSFDLSVSPQKSEKAAVAFAGHFAGPNGGAADALLKGANRLSTLPDASNNLPPPEGTLLHTLLSSSVVPWEDWWALDETARQGICSLSDDATVLAALAEHGLLTNYQLERIQAGKQEGLVLDNYRILDILGTGQVSVVYRAEHVFMRRQVAVKALPVSADQDARCLARFLFEMRVLARLRHPHIVTAFDAGKLQGPGRAGTLLHYFVMEFVPGKNLEALVQTDGPLPPEKACLLIYQIAGALAEAQKSELIHRDIKPSNIIRTPDGDAKLLDFGLARHRRHRLTDHGTFLGSVDYTAPEQTADATSVDIRADIYGLGGVLFWCLTGRKPFSASGDMASDLARRLSQGPPSARSIRPEIPEELDHLVARMMALKPEDRYQNSQALLRALVPFLEPAKRQQLQLPELPGSLPKGLGTAGGKGDRPHRILIVDDDRLTRTYCREILKPYGYCCDEAASGPEALEALRSKTYDLVLLDVLMPRMTGPEVCRRLRAEPPYPNLKILMLSGYSSGEELAEIMLTGANDYLRKPLSPLPLYARIKAMLELKDAQDRSDLFNRHLLAVNHELEKGLHTRDSDLVHARNALVLALAQLVKYRCGETGAELTRMQHYARCLAEEAAASPAFAGQVDPHFIDLLACCAPLVDIGKVGLPDHILQNPGKLNRDERALMETHTTIGAETLNSIAGQFAFARAFLQMAVDIARHHHERYDGAGYPDGLKGTTIPLAARIVAFGDVYDSLRSRRSYRAGFSHAAALQVMKASEGQFDPLLFQAFLRCAPEFEKIFLTYPD
jgi:response regulator RpfG family c-di-GMP phosphodiesterase